MVSPSLLGDEEKLIVTTQISYWQLYWWWMTCNKVAMVVSSISKHRVCPNPLLPNWMA